MPLTRRSVFLKPVTNPAARFVTEQVQPVAVFFTEARSLVVSSNPEDTPAAGLSKSVAIGLTCTRATAPTPVSVGQEQGCCTE
jgi:hypothetical protein